MAAGGSVHSNLCPFRLSHVSRRDDFVDDSQHRGAWQLCDAACIQFPLHYSRGLSHARLRHFLPDAGTCRIASFLVGFLQFLRQHVPILTFRWKPYSPISHTCGVSSRFLPISLSDVSASASRGNRGPRRWKVSGPGSRRIIPDLDPSFCRRRAPPALARKHEQRTAGNTTMRHRRFSDSWKKAPGFTAVGRGCAKSCANIAERLRKPIQSQVKENGETRDTARPSPAFRLISISLAVQGGTLWIHKRTRCSILYSPAKFPLLACGPLIERPAHRLGKIGVSCAAAAGRMGKVS